MKLKHLLLGALVGVAFTACTSDDEPAVKGKQNLEGEQYMAVRFVMPGNSASTRAQDWSNEDGFEAATGNEIAVDGVTFMFFDGENQVADVFNTAEYNNKESWTPGTTDNEDLRHEAIIVLKNAIHNPTSIVAILNTSGISVTRETTMSQLMAMTGDFRKDDASNFVMSNSVYLKDGKVQVATPVAAYNIQETVEAAKANPVKIAVEKVVAKVMMTDIPKDTDTDKTTKEGKKVSVEVEGWWLDSTNPKSYLMKHLETTYADLGNWQSWNDDANLRSYWVTPLANDNPEHFAWIDRKPFSDVFYAHENTDQTKPTMLVVAANLSVEGAKEGESIIQFLSEVYTQTDFETQLYGTVSTKYYTFKDDTYTSVTKDMFKFDYATNTKDATVQFNGADIKDYEAVVTMTYIGTDKLYTYNESTKTGTEVPEADYKADFASRNCKVQYWNGGKTYYFTPIVQNVDVTVGEGETAHPLYGVVRNHLYRVTINSITGLGTPIAETDSHKVIIPEIPDDKESYISAEVVIFKYKVVDVDVDLGK